MLMWCKGTELSLGLADSLLILTEVLLARSLVEAVENHDVGLKLF
jgi:hypothetical protein